MDNFVSCEENNICDRNEIVPTDYENIRKKARQIREKSTFRKGTVEMLMTYFEEISFGICNP